MNHTFPKTTHKKDVVKHKLHVVASQKFFIIDDPIAESELKIDITSK